MNTAKAEFKSCLTTGMVGLLFGVSIVMSAYYLSDQSNKNSQKENAPQKILKHSPQAKKANYWIPLKDR